MKRKAKIICTIGPTSCSLEKLRALIAAGMDVARLNFSHGDHAGHLEVIQRLRIASKEAGKYVAILQDLQGPKLRIGRFKERAVTLVNGQTFTISTRERDGDETGVSTPYTRLPQDVSAEDYVLLRDGVIRMQVQRTTDTDVICTVVDGGLLSDRSGMALPGVRISEPSLTAKDKEDLEFGIANNVDFIALSFVREPGDLDEIKRRVRKKGIPIVAKLETADALQHLDKIIAAADVVMVARGDLGVEIPAARVPLVQKDIIERCHHAGVPVITATQMLESMASQPIPTRAEASDVANAVFDGSDAVMLSVETAFGDYPIKAVAVMASILEEVAGSGYFRLTKPRMRTDRLASAQAICGAAHHIAESVGARAVVACTTTGITARLLSKYRPAAPILGFSRYPATLRRMALMWGVTPVLMDAEKDVERFIHDSITGPDAPVQLEKGDKVVITSGSSLTAGGTNLLRLYTHR